MRNVRNSPLFLLLGLAVLVWGCGGGGGSTPTQPAFDDAAAGATADAKKLKDPGVFTVSFAFDGGPSGPQRSQESGSNLVIIDSWPNENLKAQLAAMDPAMYPDYATCFGGDGYDGSLKIKADRKDATKWIIEYEFGGHVVGGDWANSRDRIGYKLTLTTDTAASTTGQAGDPWPVLNLESSTGSGGTWELRGFRPKQSCLGTGDLVFDAVVSRGPVP